MKRPGRPRLTPIRTASPTLRMLFGIMDEAGVSLNAMALDLGKHTARVSEYRRGRVEPGIMSVEAMADALGYDLVLRKRKE